MGIQLTGAFTMGANAGGGTGTLYTVDYTADLVSLNGYLSSITAELITLNAFLELNLSDTAAVIPRTPAASMLVQARALNLIAEVLSANMGIQEGTNGSISSLNTSLASISAAMSDIGASANIQLAQNMEKNAFEMQAANTAREEAGLPKVEVSHSTMSEKIKGTAATAVDVAAMTNTAGLVQSGINRATGFAGNMVSDYITAPAGSFIAEQWANTKKFFGFNTEAVTKKATAEAKIASNNALTG